MPVTTISPLHTLTARENGAEVRQHIESLLRETRPANVIEIGRALLDMPQTETVAMMLAMARAHYRVLTTSEAEAPVVEPSTVPAGEPIARIQVRCQSCGRTALSGQMGPVGTIETVERCGMCEARARKATPVEPTIIDVPAPEAPVATGSGWDGEILDGIYTVEFEGGEYRTLKVKTQATNDDFKPGARLISYLNGPDDWRNYKGFGEVEPGNRLKVWHKSNTPGMATVIKAALALLAGPEAMVDGLKAYGRASRKCGICSQPLSTPESLELGIGPVCAGRMGL